MFVHLLLDSTQSLGHPSNPALIHSHTKSKNIPSLTHLALPQYPLSCNEHQPFTKHNPVLPPLCSDIFHFTSSRLRKGFTLNCAKGSGDPAAPKQPPEQLPGHLHTLCKLPAILKLGHEPSPVCRTLRQLQEEFPQGNHCHFFLTVIEALKPKKLNRNCRRATVASSGRTQTHSHATTPSQLEGQFEVHGLQQCCRMTPPQGWGAGRTPPPTSPPRPRGPRTAPRLEKLEPPPLKIK